MIGLIRRFYLLVLLTASVAIPYVLMSDSTGPVRDKIRAVFASQSKEAEPIAGIMDPEVNRLLATQQELLANAPAATANAGTTPTVTLESVLRFDVTPRWVMQNWPHVSTSRAEAGLDGMRVPVLTGTTPQDVVGSLTYYFDRQQRVQRVTLDGVMGDERRLVSIVTGVFKLKPEPAAGVGIYVLKWNGDLISALWIRRMPVVHRGTGAAQFEFALELNRPGNYHGLSARLQQQIQRAHASMPYTMR